MPGDRRQLAPRLMCYENDVSVRSICHRAMLPERAASQTFRSILATRWARKS